MPAWYFLIQTLPCILLLLFCQLARLTAAICWQYPELCQSLFAIFAYKVIHNLCIIMLVIVWVRHSPNSPYVGIQAGKQNGYNLVHEKKVIYPYLSDHQEYIHESTWTSRTKSYGLSPWSPGRQMHISMYGSISIFYEHRFLWFQWWFTSILAK